MIFPHQGLSVSSAAASTEARPQPHPTTAAAGARPPVFTAPARPAPVDPLADFVQKAAAERRIPPLNDVPVTGLLRTGHLGEIVAFLLHLDSVVDINADSRLRNRVLLALGMSRREAAMDFIRDALQCFTSTPEDVLRDALQTDNEPLAHAALLADETGSTLGLFSETLARFRAPSVKALLVNADLLSRVSFPLLSEAFLGHTPTPNMAAASLRRDMMELMYRAPSRCEEIMREAERLGCDDEPLLWQYALDYGREHTSPQFAALAQRKLAQAAEREAFQPIPPALERLNDAQFIERVLAGLGAVETKLEAMRAMRRHPDRAEAIMLHLARTDEIDELILQHALDLAATPRSKGFWNVALRLAPDEAMASFHKRPESIDHDTLRTALELGKWDVLERACRCRPEALHERHPTTGDTPAHLAARSTWDRRPLQICRRYGADMDAVNLSGETPRSINPEGADEAL